MYVSCDCSTATKKIIIGLLLERCFMGKHNGSLPCSDRGSLTGTSTAVLVCVQRNKDIRSGLPLF